MSVKMIANRRTTYAGQKLQAGDKFEASNKDAMVLQAIGVAQPFAEEAPDAAVPVADISELPKEPQQRRRTYRNRELQSDIESPDSKPRNYRRRDMVAEGDDA